MQKKNYEIPEAELIRVKFEENFCVTNPNDPAGDYGDNNMDPLDDDNN